MKIERINKIANYMKDIEGKIVVNKLLERLNSISFWELLSECTKIEIPIIQIMHKEEIMKKPTKSEMYFWIA